MKDKKQQLDALEWRINALRLKAKYAKTPLEKIMIALDGLFTWHNGIVIQSQSIPKYKSGAVVNNQTNPEIIELPNGKRVEINRK